MTKSWEFTGVLDLWKVVPVARGLTLSGPYLKLLRLGAGAGISDFSTSLAAASCICWALMWMVGAGTLAMTLRERRLREVQI